MSRTSAVLVAAGAGLLALGSSCGGVDSCAAPCERLKGSWTAQTRCPYPDLAALPWQVTLGASAGLCQLEGDFCQDGKRQSAVAAHDCDTGLSVFRFGAATCSIKVDDSGDPTATCRLNDHACDFTLVRASTPALSCTTARDAGAQGDGGGDGGGSTPDAPSNGDAGAPDAPSGSDAGTADARARDGGPLDGSGA